MLPEIAPRRIPTTSRAAPNATVQETVVKMVADEGNNERHVRNGAVAKPENSNHP
jgi:hypothetical protein